MSLCPCPCKQPLKPGHRFAGKGCGPRLALTGKPKSTWSIKPDTPPLTTTTAKKAFISNGAWWADSPREHFTARAEQEVSRMRLAGWSTFMTAESLGEARVRKLARRSAGQVDEP
jgi:hypothetical protein